MCDRRHGRLRRTRRAVDRSSSRSARSRRCRGTGPSRSFWTPAVVHTSMRRCGSMTRVSDGRGAGCDSLRRCHDARVSSCSPSWAAKPRVGCRFGGCIRPSGSAGDSFPRKASRRGRSPAWMSTRPMTAAVRVAGAGPGAPARTDRRDRFLLPASEQGIAGEPCLADAHVTSLTVRSKHRGEASPSSPGT